jgi:hypothetical protein
VFGKVSADEFVSVRRRPQRHPDDAHLGATIGIDGDQGDIRTLADEFAGGVVESYALFYTSG